MSWLSAVIPATFELRACGYDVDRVTTQRSEMQVLFEEETIKTEIE